METSIAPRSKTLRTRATRMWIPAVLGLMCFAQPAWSAITISPSPSYDGAYTVTWGSPLGCATYYDDFGFPWEVCYELTEQQGDQYGPVTGRWTSGSSLNISGKSAGTYTYTVTAYFYSSQWGNSVQTAEGPTSVQVILPLPDPNLNYQHWTGPGNDPQSYRIWWNATNASSCDLLITWWTSPSTGAGSYATSVATSGQAIVEKGAPNMDFAHARVTCYGPGGENYEQVTLDFNPLGN